ncbi:MAG: hypothetical protein V3U45_04465 [bacterium]
MRRGTLNRASQGDGQIVEASGESRNEESIPEPSVESPQGRELVQKGREGVRAAQDFPTRKNEVSRPQDLPIREAN